MKLYRKKLNGLEELRREKIKLRYQKRHLDKLHSVHPVERDKSRPAGSGFLHTILDLAGDGNSTSSAIQIGSMLVNQLGKRRRKKQAAMYTSAEFRKPKSTARIIFDDMFWSYVTGKAVRVSFGMLRDSLKKRKSHLRK